MQRGFAPIIILLFIVIAGSIIGAFVYYKSGINNETFHVAQPTIAQQPTSVFLMPIVTSSEEISPISDLNQKKTVVDNFLLLVSAEINRDVNGYQVKESLIPKVASDEEKVLLQEALRQEKLKSSIYKVETVNSDGRKEMYYSEIGYCPPNTDACSRLITEEIPFNANGFLKPIFVAIRTNTKTINFYIKNDLVKSLERKESAFNISNLTKTPSSRIENNQRVDGYEISWEIESVPGYNTWLILEYRSSPEKWGNLGFGDSDQYKSYFVNPKTIQSTLENIDFRLLVTDGFTVLIRQEEDFIIASKDRDLYLSMRGLDSEGRVGQNANVDISFIDPETGAGCDGQGCTHGENKGKYIVTWHSDKQNICPTDLYKGILQYVFKKEGTHTISVKVQHKEKPYLKAETSFKVLVHPSDYPYEDKNPNCSFGI